MVAPHSTRRSSTSGAHRYSSGRRSNASSSGVAPSSSAASVYSARAWPISFWAIEENATSSSRNGAIPVHSELRQPRISSSSASSSRSCARALTCLLQPRLDRVAVDAAVLEVELVRELLDRVDRVAGDDPERDRLLTARVELPRICVGELPVRRMEGAAVDERLSLALLPEDLPDHLGRLREHDLRDPVHLRPREPPECEPLLRRRPVPRHDREQLVPIGLRVLPDAVVAPPQLGIRDLEPELADLRDVPLEELLPRLLVALALDPPDHHRVLVGGDRRAVEVHQRAPPAVHGFLHELELLRCPRDHREHGVAAVEDVKRLLPADLLHHARVRRIGALEERLLADDRRGVDEPRDHADVAPTPRRVVEDVVELRPARDEVVEAGAARLPEVLDDAVDELAVADLVLDLRRQCELPLQRRRAQDPVPLREHPHQLGVPVHLDELDQPGAVLGRHPVVRLDEPAGLDIVEKLLLARFHVVASLPNGR